MKGMEDAKRVPLMLVVGFLLLFSFGWLIGVPDKKIDEAHVERKSRNLTSIVNR